MNFNTFCMTSGFFGSLPTLVGASEVLEEYTVEELLLTMVEALADAQSSPTVNPDGLAPIQTYTYNGLTGEVAINVNLAASASPSENGKMTLQATEIFTI